MQDVLSEIPKPPKLEFGDPLLNILSTEPDDILKTEYVNYKDLNEKEIEDTKKKYNLEDIL